MVKNNIIWTEDEFKLWDKLAAEGPPRNGPRGWVKAYMDGKKFFEGPNLIVAKGREFVAQKIFGINNDVSGGTRPAFHQYVISHFAVGSGGATVDGHEVTLTGPTVADTGLYSSITLGDELYLNEPAHIENGTEDPIIHSYHNAVKPITTDGDIVLEPVSYEGSPDYYTKVRCTCVVPPGEPSALDPGASTPISEAGLYFVNASLAETDPEKVQMFAHICFPPKWKEKEATISIFWYILC